MPLKKSQKAIILISAAWSIISLLISGSLASDSYDSHFSIIGFFAIFIICALPVLIYWGGLWIWGWGYILRGLKCLSPAKIIKTKVFRFVFRVRHFEKMNDAIQTAEVAKKITIRMGNSFVVLGVIVAIGSLTDFLSNVKTANSEGTFVSAILFITLGWFLKYRRSPTAAIVIAILSLFYVTVGIALLLSFESALTVAAGAFFALLGVLVLNGSMRAYFAAKKLHNKAFPSSEDYQSNIRLFSWKANIGLSLIWFITPLSLAYLIYDFSGYGIGNKIGSFLVVSALSSLVIRAIQKHRGKEYKPIYALGAILLAAVIQLGIDSERLIEVKDANALQKELKAASADKYWDVIKSSHTKVGAALRSGFEIGEQVNASMSSLREGVVCTPSLIEKLLDPNSLRSRAKRQALITVLKPKYENSLSAKNKIDTIYEAAYKSFDGINGVTYDTRSSILNGFKDSAEKLIPFEKAYMQAYGDLYKSIFDLYDFLDKNALNYQVDVGGTLLFADQITLDEYNQYRTALSNAADNVDAAEKRLIDKQTEIHNNTVSKMQSH